MAAAPDVVFFEGLRYRFSQGYYRRGSSARLGQRFLHRAVWIKRHGPILEGMVVHHRDGDTRNNSIGNLELLPVAEHHRLHFKEQWDRARADPEFLRERVDRNSRWHRSEEGRAAASRLNAKNRAAGKYEGHDKSAFYAGRDRWAASPECAEFNRQHALRLHAEGKVPPPSEECRQRAAEWHRSDEGRAWHREHGVATWANRKLSSVACVVCGGAFDTPYPTRAKFCSSSCKYQAAKARSAGAGV
jgi:hypothetical protein